MLTRGKVGKLLERDVKQAFMMSTTTQRIIGTTNELSLQGEYRNAEPDVNEDTR